MIIFAWHKKSPRINDAGASFVVELTAEDNGLVAVNDNPVF